MVRSTESASTPISAGGWKYNPEDPQDVQDFANFTAAQLRELEREQSYDFSLHPASEPSTDYGMLTDYATGTAIRPATADEHARSLAAGETGAFEADDDELGAVFVSGGPES